MKTALLQLAMVVVAGLALPVPKTSRQGDFYKFCNTSLESVAVYDVTVSPNPPQRGHKVMISITYELTERLMAGKIKVELKINFFTFYDKTLDLCEVLESADITCPYGPTSVTTYSMSEDLPSVGGHVTGQISVTDQNDKQILCIDIDGNL